MISPIRFIRQVEAELKKVTWPTKKETQISTLMVLVMVVIATSFFLLIDVLSREIIRILFGFGG